MSTHTHNSTSMTTTRVCLPSVTHLGRMHEFEFVCDMPSSKIEWKHMNKTSYSLCITASSVATCYDGYHAAHPESPSTFDASKQSIDVFNLHVAIDAIHVVQRIINKYPYHVSEYSRFFHRHVTCGWRTYTDVVNATVHGFLMLLASEPEPMKFERIAYEPST